MGQCTRRLSWAQVSALNPFWETTEVQTALPRGTEQAAPLFGNALFPEPRVAAVEMVSGQALEII